MSTVNYNLKIGFLLDRSSHIKAYAPVIIEARKRGHNIFVLCQNSHHLDPRSNPHSASKENMTIPGSDKISFFYFENSSELLSLIDQYRLSEIFILPFRENSYDNFLKKIKSRSFKLYCLQWYGDYLVIDPSLLNILDGLFVYSQEVINSYLRVYPNTAENIHKFISIGFPPRESLNFIPGKEELRRHYQIPKDKKVVLLFSLNIGGKDAFWLHSVFGKPNRLKSALKCLLSGHFRYIYESLFGIKYKNIIIAIKKWCRKNNAVLVVKSRPKHHEPVVIKQCADFLITDDSSWFPLKSFECLRFADLAIHFNSSSVLEAAVSNVYSLSIFLPKLINPTAPSSLSYPYYRHLFDFPGVSKKIIYKNFSRFIKKNKIEDFKTNSISLEKYLLKNTGFLDNFASKRIIDRLEE